MHSASMTNDLPAEIAGLARWQAGVISRRQVLEAGLNAQLMAHPDDERWRDSQRDNNATAQGVETCRYGWRDVYAHACETALLQAQILRRRGWRGIPRPCSPRCPVGRVWPVTA
jgi:hypothetical protein